MMATDTPSQQVTLNRLTDRCDRCGSEAFVKAKVLTGGELLLCAHHANEHEGVLCDPTRIEILADERQRLLAEAEEFKRTYSGGE